MNALLSRSAKVSLNNLHDRFLALLPRIQTHAQICFQHIHCPQKRADRVAEAVALSWKWFQTLVQRGKDPALFPTTLATYAVKGVRAGRKVVGMEKGKDVMNPVAQKRHGFVVGKLPDYATLETNPLNEALIDNRQTSPDEQAAFRLDFAAWLRSLSRRDKHLVTDMGLGERTKDLAHKYGCSPGRVSQKRLELCGDWKSFCER